MEKIEGAAPVIQYEAHSKALGGAMAEETVNIIIHPDGRVELQVCGVKGEKCLEVTKAVEEALGSKVKREFTSEMYETEVETESEKEKRKLGY